MSELTQADIDAAEKRGRAIGTANASRRFSESLPEAIRQQKKEIASAEGVAWAGYTYDDAETANPYRTTTTKETTP
ncbi:hypothetical protein [Aeromicrobium sp. UC242_57]|uniref:hypothetical protein n=1 Tax=Aeromicrobium sp. UC242_57 TaxID=3374624 RepID=UPI0037974785